jgi:hypothetical protein
VISVHVLDEDEAEVRRSRLSQSFHATSTPLPRSHADELEKIDDGIEPIGSEGVLVFAVTHAKDPVDDRRARFESRRASL